MFNKELKEEVARLQKEVAELSDYHKKCPYCRKIGHKEEMINTSYIPDGSSVINYSFYYDWATNCNNNSGTSTFSMVPEYYHPECYAKKFNKHKCECGCGKWIENKTNKKEEA